MPGAESVSLTGSFALVALGGAAGGLLRVWLTALVDRLFGPRLPWGTLAVNVSGSTLLGAGAGMLVARGIEPTALPFWAALGIGLLGSYTTVSSFALQAHALLLGRRGRAALAYALLSLGLCLAGAAGGLTLGRWAAG